MSDRPSLEATTTGFAVGADSSKLLDDTIIGVALSYGMTEAVSAGANQIDMDVESYHLTACADRRLPNDIYARGMAAHVYSENAVIRQDVGGIDGQIATDDYASNLFTVYG